MEKLIYISESFEKVRFIIWHNLNNNNKVHSVIITIEIPLISNEIQLSFLLCCHSTVDIKSVVEFNHFTKRFF